MVSPGWISVTPKLAEAELPSSAAWRCSLEAERVSWARRAAVVIVAVGAQHHEFFAAVAGYQVARAAGVLQQPGEALDHLVASLVAVGVVDFLKRSMSAMIRLQGRLLSRCAATNNSCTRSNSARLATCVSGSFVASSCRLRQRCSSEISGERRAATMSARA